MYCPVWSTVQCDVLSSVIYCPVWSTVQCDLLSSVIYCTVWSTVQCDVLSSVIYCPVWSTVQCDLLSSVIYCSVWSNVHCDLLSVCFTVQFKSYNLQRNWVFVTNSDFLIHIFFPPYDGVNLWYLKRRFFYLPEFIVWNI